MHEVTYSINLSNLTNSYHYKYYKKYRIFNILNDLIVIFYFTVHKSVRIKKRLSTTWSFSVEELRSSNTYLYNLYLLKTAFQWKSYIVDMDMVNSW